MQRGTRRVVVRTVELTKGDARPLQGEMRCRSTSSRRIRPMESPSNTRSPSRAIKRVMSSAGAGSRSGLRSSVRNRFVPASRACSCGSSMARGMVGGGRASAENTRTWPASDRTQDSPDGAAGKPTESPSQSSSLSPSSSSPSLSDRSSVSGGGCLAPSLARNALPLCTLSIGQSKIALVERHAEQRTVRSRTRPCPPVNLRQRRCFGCGSQPGNNWVPQLDLARPPARLITRTHSIWAYRMRDRDAQTQLRTNLAAGPRRVARRDVPRHCELLEVGHQGRSPLDEAPIAALLLHLVATACHQQGRYRGWRVELLSRNCQRPQPPTDHSDRRLPQAGRNEHACLRSLHSSFHVGCHTSQLTLGRRQLH